MISTTDDECRVGRDAFVRPFILISDGSPARAVRRRAIAPLRPPVRRGHIHTYSNHTNPIYIHRPPPKKTNYSKKHPPSTHTSIAHAPPRGERVLDRWASLTSHDSTDRSTARDATRRDASTRLDDARPWRCETRRTTPPRGANPRDRRRNCASYRAGASRTIETIARRARASSSRVPCVTRMERATDGLFAPRRARA